MDQSNNSRTYSLNAEGGYDLCTGNDIIGTVADRRHAVAWWSQPELLAALERICRHASECAMHGEPSQVDGIAWGDILHARAAIAKAKGEGK